MVSEYDPKEVFASQVGFVVAMNNAVERYDVEFDDLPKPLWSFLTDITAAAEEYLKTGE